MNKRTIINKYFESFRAKDIELLKSVFCSDLGLRTFNGDLFFDFNEVEVLYNNFQLKTVEITKYDEIDNVVYINFSIIYTADNEEISENVVARFVFKKNLIYRVYETIEKVGYSRIMCTVTYDGSVYNGFQRQPGLVTVQGEIEKALYYLTKEQISIYSSGRTDKGVHAINQTFHFDTLSNILPIDFARVLGNYLPDAIHLKSSELVHPTFHARYDSYSKEYVYKLNIGENDPIQRNFEWHVGEIDINILRNELYSIKGTHDFTSFTKTKQDKTMIRTIYSVDVQQKEEFIYISIVGSGFLRYMVRYLVGTAVEIAKHGIDDKLIDIINLKDSSKVLWKAPSAGLYLKEVTYNKFENVK